MTEERHILEARAAELAEKELDWNELDFVGWKEFRRMAPAVIRLEISRLERLMGALEPGSRAYNGLVRTRYELRQFVNGIESADRDSLSERAEHLGRALLAASLLTDELGDERADEHGDERGAELGEDLDAEGVRYAVHRLRYIHHRLNLIY